jgi:hypothetical protein
MRNLQNLISRNKKSTFLLHHLHHAKHNYLIIKYDFFYNFVRRTNQPEKVNHYQWEKYKVVY